MASKREPDINGWYEIKENPLSKVGVFPYTGAMIDPTGKFNLDPDKIYNVLRSKEELSDPETIDSFKLVPWINDHVMLGEKKEGRTPAEEKGISGVIGQDVFFDDKDQMLKGNVKVFSESLKDDIEEGKEELSLGYHCAYDKKNGMWNGQGYEFVQICIRGNHMASVDEGRMGSEVAVLDGSLLTFTIDSKEFTKMAMTPEEMEEALTKLTDLVNGLGEKVGELISSKETEDEDPDKETEDEDPDKETEDEDPDKETEDEDPDKETEDEGPDKETEDEDPDKKADGMDSLKSDNKKLKKTVKRLVSTVDKLEQNGMKTMLKEMGKKNILADRLSHYIGTFDHSEMTLGDVNVYGIKKLKIPCKKGSEAATLDGFLHNRVTPTTGHGFDSKATGGSSFVDDYVNNDKK